MFQQLLEHDDARTVANDVGVQGELKEAVFPMCLLEFVEPYAQEFAWRCVWPRARIAVHREIRGIIEDPFNRDLDDPGGRSICQ